jgi:hypothetical protein
LFSYSLTQGAVCYTYESGDCRGCVTVLASQPGKREDGGEERQMVAVVVVTEKAKKDPVYIYINDQEGEDFQAKNKTNDKKKGQFSWVIIAKGKMKKARKERVDTDENQSSISRHIEAGNRRVKRKREKGGAGGGGRGKVHGRAAPRSARISREQTEESDLSSLYIITKKNMYRVPTDLFCWMMCVCGNALTTTEKKKN